MFSFEGRALAYFFRYIQRLRISTSEHYFKVTCSHPALSIIGPGGNLITYYYFEMFLTFIICCLFGFTSSDYVGRRVVIRSLNLLATNKLPCLNAFIIVIE